MVKPDYDYWAAQPEFSRIDAAFLCCDLEPEAVKRGEFGPPKVAAMYRRIADELPNRPTGWNGLTVASGRGGAVTIGGDSYVSREDLRQWAEATGQRAAMPFLFPEDREPKEELENNPDSLREDGKQTLLLLIGLLARTLREDPINSKEKPWSEVYRMLARRAKQWGLDTKETLINSQPETEIKGMGRSNFYRLLEGAEQEVKNNKTGGK